MILITLAIIIFYLSYLAFPLLIYAVWPYSDLNRPMAIILILLILIFIYARFIEPNIIKIRWRKIKLDKKDVSPFQIAVFSDIHLNLLTKEKFLKRVVKKINEIKPDFILIPGDFVLCLKEKEIKNKFYCLKNLAYPTFAVLGNHDYGDIEERDVSEELKKILTEYGLKVIDDKIENLTIKKQSIKIIGLSDLETRKPNYDLIKNLCLDNINIVLAHNPDIAYEFPSYGMDLVVCGHTHGGQVRIYPLYQYAYKYIVKMKRDFDKGLRCFRGTKVFITTGVGLGGLPFRLLMPPVIDILEIE